ncbi:MAG: ABC transporter permease [Actinomycetota bacterium]
MSQLVRKIRDRADLVALGAILAVVPLLPRGVPGGIFGLGLVSGAGLALQAIGLVLIYRSNRIINFAQVQIGVLVAVLFRLLVEQRTILSLLHSACPPCVGRQTTLAIAVNYWLSLVLALGVAVLLSFLLYRFIIRRFADAPRLVLTVATIGISQFLAFIQVQLPTLLATADQRRLHQLPIGPAATPPLSMTVKWSPAIFRAPDVLTVLITAGLIGLLLLYFRKSSTGIAIRASAENRDRAQTLGIDVDRTTQRVWIVAGMLSGVAALLVAMSQPAPLAASLDVGITVRILAAAVIASMTSIPIAAIAAVALGIFDQAMLWAFRSTAPVDGLMTGVIGVVLLLQRARYSRVEQELSGAWRAAREIRPIPREMRGLHPVRRASRLLTIGGGILLLGFPFVMSPTQTNVTTISLIYAMVGMSLLILSGWAGQISLGQFAFAAVGGYVASLASVNAHLPLIACLIVAGLTGAVAAVLIGLPALKMRGLHLAITTLAVALTTTAVLLNPAYLGSYLPDAVKRGSFLGISLESHRSFYYFTLAILGLIVFATVGLRRSRIGRALLAARDNEPAAQSFGIAPVRARLGAFAMSGAIAAVAGAMFVFHQFGLKSASFTASASVAMFLMTVIGGLGSVAGPLFGAGYLGILSLFSSAPAVVFIATGGGVVALLLLAPGGLVQLAADIRDGWLRRIAKRYRMVVPSLLADVRTGTNEARVPIAPKQGAFVGGRYQLEDHKDPVDVRP